jgi:hypothetical protein
MIDDCQQPAWARLTVEGNPGVCIRHMRLQIELLLFIAREGPQTELEIVRQMARFEELYPFPDAVVE